MSSYLSYNLQIKIYRLKCFFYNLYINLEYLGSNNIVSENEDTKKSKDTILHPISAPSAPPLFECPICFDNVCDNNYCVLKCGHEYHLECIFELYNQDEDFSNKCPLCRNKYMEKLNNV